MTALRWLTLGFSWAAVAGIAPSCHGNGAPLPPIPPPTGDACQDACGVLESLCGPQLADCVRVLASVDGRQLKRKPDGGALTCADVAAQVTVAGLASVGVYCSQ